MPESKSSVMESLWAELLAQIAAVIPEQSFQTWIQPIRPERFDDNTLILNVPSQFHYEWIDSHYSQQIRQLLCQTTGKEIRVLFSVAPKNGASQPRQGPASLPCPRPHSPRTPASEESQLNPRYVFDNFVEGDGNSFARAACLAIGEAPGKTPWNPLLIYGGSGLGKTHLLHAIGNFALANKKVKRVKYATSEKYAQEFIHSVKNNRSTDFSTLYRSTDLLLVDDIHFFAAKNRTQAEFFHTFNSLHQAGKQIVLTSDRPVHELDDIDERLISRFQSGLITQISPPDFETRVAIIERRADEEGVLLPADVAQFFATHVVSNIRELEGALITLLARAAFHHSEPSVELAGEVLREKMGRTVMKPPVEHIQDIVAQRFGLSVDALRGKSRKKEIALARMIAMALATENTNNSLKRIGQLFGGRDHTTVIHARDTIRKLLETDSLIRETYDTLLKKIK
jgi:chromosomal replication initiator protein